MRHPQIEHIVAIDQHVLSLEVEGAGWDGAWENDAFGSERGIGVARAAISFVGFARDSGKIAVYVEVLSAPPEDGDLDDYQGVLEASLVVPGGKLLLVNESDRVPAVTLPTAADDAWRVRIYYADGDTARGDMAEGAEHARIVLFPGPKAPTKVLRARVEGELVRTYRGTRSEQELLAMLTSENLSSRCLAVVALVRTGRLDAVRRVATSGGPKLVWASSVWMAGEAARADLRTLARDPDPLIRGRVARSIALGGDGTLADVVESLLTDLDPSVRDDARFAMSTLDPSYVITPEAAPAQARPRLIFCNVASLGTLLTEKARAKYGERPLWFGRGSDQEGHPVSLFDRVAEPRSNKVVEEILSVLGTLPRNADIAESLHALVGDDDSLFYGFHVGATLEQAREAFLADGYELIERREPGVAWPPVLGR